MNSEKQNIVITGFMGTGKSTVAPIVAERLGRDYMETDAEIEALAGKTIPEIFAKQGEVAFRQMERELCRYLTTQHGLVISTGGGMLVNDKNRRLMLESAFVVCLTAEPETIENRIIADVDGRPLAGNWRELLQKRQSAYGAIPHQINTTDKSPQAIAEEILTLWRNESQ